MGDEEFSETYHIHPSLICYKFHDCRCTGCKAAHRAFHRPEHDHSIPHDVLPHEELVRLRKLVGISA